MPFGGIRAPVAWDDSRVFHHHDSYGFVHTFIGLLALWWLFEKPALDTILKLGLAILPSLLVVAAANWARYHSVFDHGYTGERFTTPLLVGLDGILFSGGKSIFLFSPPLILGFPRMGSDFASGSPRELTRCCFWAVFVAELLFYSKWWDWSSDDAWGVRFYDSLQWY